MKLFRALALCSVLVGLLAFPAPGRAEEPAGQELVVTTSGGLHSLSLGEAASFHTTANEVVDDRVVALPDSPGHLALWSEVSPGGEVVPFYGISLDGNEMATVRRTSYVLQLRHAKFDPAASEPSIQQRLAAAPGSELYLVQFVTQPLQEYRDAIRALGGQIQKFIASHAHFVRMSPDARDQVAALPFVRWVGPVHLAYKLEEEIQQQILADAEIAPRRYSIMLHERGVPAQDRVVAAIEELGGLVHGTTPLGFRVEATLSLAQVHRLAALDDVMFIDRKSKLEIDLDIVRETGGADYLESVAGFTGQGVRAEVADTELDETHPEWSAPPLIHRAGGGTLHGTSVYGILFAQGVNPQARGIIPDAVGIFANSTGLLGGGQTRYTHTAELVDPAGPYRAVLQTNSTGDGRTFFYTTISAETDDILFINDILITQSQSNAGNQDSRPQAWAKNIVSGGAFDHFNTVDPSDDCWSCGSGSIGPADDGRIKPDLSFFYDLTLSASSGGGYTEFGGTSGATPSIAGYFGLFFQMWSEQVFGNDVPNPGGTVFENRPHMTTAKAALINTATQHPFTGQSHDMTRVHQGWGVPSVQSLYDQRDKIGFVDETEILQNLESIEFVAFVETGAPALRVTMTYADPMGNPAASVHRINDLSLKLTSPSSTVYWGNNGLLDGNWSTPGGTENNVDTVENVFVENPEAGVWTIEVIASEINEDSHVETPEIDADFALVVTGADLTNCSSEGRIQLDRALYACGDPATIRVVDCDLNLSDTAIDTVSVTITSDSEPGGETVLLTETAETTADFRGTIPTSLTDASAVLQVSHADVMTATYIDADDGMGGTNVVLEDTGTLDCAAPVISNIQAVNITGAGATVSWNTDEVTDGSLTYGEFTPPGTTAASIASLVTSHSVDLAGLDQCTVYSFSVSATDEAGNGVVDDNAGAYHTFATGVDNKPEFASTDTPLSIADNTTFTSDLIVGATETVLDVDVRLNITHTYTGDLDIFLVGPDNTRVELTTDSGGSGDNFIDTVFDDEATISVTGGAAPFTGSYQPEGSLATLDGLAAAGTWTLEVTDDAGGDTGQLVDWTLILTFEATQCGPVAEYVSHQIEVDACATGSGGVGNGYWDAGEQLEFSIAVHNDGTDAITGALATVATSSPGVTLIDASAGVGDVAAGAVVDTQAPHLMAQISDTVTCGTQLDFDLTLTSGQGSWNAAFQQIVGELILARSGTVLSEDLAGGAIPAGWTVIDGNADGHTWFADSGADPSGCQSANPAIPPFADSWLAVDSSCTPGGTKMDEELISPSIDLSTEPQVTLEFDHWFEWSSQRRDEIADVDVRSSNTGGAWVNVARWTGVSTANTEHAMVDITAEAGNAPDAQIRFHYYNAQAEQFWYVDNVVVHFFAPEICNMTTCTPAVSSPPPVPGISADRLTIDGSEILVSWDDQCAPASTKIVYGPLDQVSSYGVSGAVCGIASPQTWSTVPAGNLWFVAISDDGAGSESSWGQNSAGERNGLTASGTCGGTTKDLSGSCP